jgi:hypothetical protein
MTAQEIIRVLAGCRFPLSNEKLLQAAIQEEFDAHGVEHSREHRLSAADIPDFMVGRIVIEIKIKGSKRNIYAQIKRYAEHAEVDELILVTNVPMGLPAKVEGKPVHLVNLARAWL